MPPAKCGATTRNSFQTSSAVGSPQVVSEALRDLREDPQLVHRAGRRIDGLAHALHAALAVGHGAFALAPRRGRGKHDVRELGGAR